MLSKNRTRFRGNLYVDIHVGAGVFPLIALVSMALAKVGTKSKVVDPLRNKANSYDIGGGCAPTCPSLVPLVSVELHSLGLGARG